MEEMVLKTYRAETKAIEGEPAIIEAIVSTSEMDRDGDVIPPGCFEGSIPAYLKHPILLSSHDYRDLRKQIGEVVILSPNSKGLSARLKYYIGEGNEEADWAYKLASKGIAAFSIGFIPSEWTDGDGEKKPRRTYTKAELLEVSQVLVPANRNALASLRAKGISPMVLDMAEKAMEIVTKPEETEDYIRVPAPGEEGMHEGHRIRTIDLNEREGIKALYCGEDKVIITYLFAKDKDWTMERAKEWVKEHSKKELAPGEIVVKYGAVLNRKNMEGLKEAQRLIQEVLDTAEKTEEAPKKQVALSNIEMGKAIAEAVLATMIKGEKQNA